MINPMAYGWVAKMQQFFNRSTDCLTEADSNFAPNPGMFTVSQHVAHTAQTIHWFLDGAFTDKGFDLDFAAHDKINRSVTSLTQARLLLDAAFQRALQIAGDCSAYQLTSETIPPNDVLGPVPKAAVFSCIEDHTAHHRGALTVYSRLLGKTPALPYM